MTPAVIEEEEMEGNGNSTHNPSNPVCIFCCYSFNPLVPAAESNFEADDDDNHQGPSNNNNNNNFSVDEDEEENGGSVVRGEKLVSVAQQQFEKFIKEVDSGLEGVNKLAEESVCQDCLKSVVRVVNAREKVLEVEEQTRGLQQEILRCMKELNGHLGKFHDELKWIQNQISTSDLACLEGCVRRGEYTEDVLVLRRKIAEVIRNCTVFRRDLESKVDIPHVGVNNSNTLNPTGISGLASSKMGRRGRPPTGRRTNNISPSNNAARDKKRGASATATPTKTDPDAKRKKLIKNTSDNFRDNEEPAAVITIEDDDDDMGTLPLTNSQSQNKETQRKTSTRTRKDAPGPKSKRGRKPGGGRTISSFQQQDPKLRAGAATVSLKNLTSEEISKMKKDLKSTTVIITTSKGKKIVKRVVMFDPSSGSSEEEEDDEDEEMEERDSLISYINKLHNNLVSRWRRRIIMGLLGKMKYQITQKVKQGLPPPKQVFEYTKRNHKLLFGKVPIVFYDKDALLGCSKCEFKTSHYETCLFDEITTHILKQHVRGNQDSMSTVSTASKRRNLSGQQKQQWDPNWEDSDNQEEEEEEEVEEKGKEVKSPPAEKNLSSRPQRKRKVPAKLADDDEDDEEDDESVPSSLNSLFTPIKSKDASSRKPGPSRQQRGQLNKLPPAPTPPPMKKLLMEKISKWNLGKEGQTALEFVRNRQGGSRKIAQVCACDEDNGKMSVVDIPIRFKEAFNTLTCSECEQRFPVKPREEMSSCTAHRDIILHVLVNHLKAFDCAICDLRNPTPASMQRHLLSHRNNQKKKEESASGSGSGAGDDKKEEMGGDAPRRKISRFPSATEGTPSENDFKRNGGKIRLKGENSVKRVEEETSSEEDDEADVSGDLLDI